MTLATLLLALLTATNAPSRIAMRWTRPVLLDFHAEWCGPCQQVRAAVNELSRKGYPVKSIDIDKASDVAARYGVDRRADLHRRRRCGPGARPHQRACSPPPRWPSSTWRPRPRPSRRSTPTLTPWHARVPGATRMTTTTIRRPGAGRGLRRESRTPTTVRSRRPADRRASPIPTRPRPSCGSRSSAPTRPASAPGRSSTARPSRRSS